MKTKPSSGPDPGPGPGPAPFLKCRTLMRMKISLLALLLLRVIFIAQKSCKLQAGECVKTASANEFKLPMQ